MAMNSSFGFINHAVIYFIFKSKELYTQITLRNASIISEVLNMPLKKPLFFLWPGLLYHYYPL